MYKSFRILCAILLLALHVAGGSNILVVCPFYGKSHSAFIHPIIIGLANNGHNITMITSNLIGDPPNNIRQIEPDVENDELAGDPELVYKLNWTPAWMGTTLFAVLTLQLTRQYIEASTVQNFLKEDNQFDVVVLESFYQEAYYGFAHKFKAPIALLGTTTYFHDVGNAMGNPPMTSYLSYEYYRNSGELDILQRTSNHLLYLYTNFLFKAFFYPKHQRILEENFGPSAPRIDELKKNISVALFNTHFTIDEVRPLIPGIVEVGGIHIKSAKKLPEDIQKFANEATDGFIYFSLGSTIRTSLMPEHKLNAIIKVLGKLKQRIIWKWEDDTKPVVSDNFMMSKWLPQSDLLAHPNIRLFITHCGMLSILEVVHRGVPIVGIPFYGDQYLNMAKIEQTGMGLGVPYNQLDEKSLMEALNKVLNEPRYTAMAKEMSKRFRDRPNSPLSTALFWIEYVIQHKGASFIRSKLATTSWFQYNLIDVYFVMFFITFAFIYMIRFLIRLCRTKPNNIAKKKN